MKAGETKTLGVRGDRSVMCMAFLGSGSRQCNHWAMWKVGNWDVCTIHARKLDPDKYYPSIPQISREGM